MNQADSCQNSLFLPFLQSVDFLRERFPGEEDIPRHGKRVKYTIYTFTLILLRMLFWPSDLFSSHDESITLRGWRIRASHKTLLPQTHWNVKCEMSGSWLSAPGRELLLQSNTNGCPEFSSVTLAARNNGQQILESFAILMLTLKFV